MIKVMIVDDMPIFLEYLKTAIDWQSYGFELVCEAKNGLEAIEKIEIHKPDLVLSDIKMPYMDGLDLTEKIKELAPETSVVLITGNSEFEYARRALRLGVVDYIVKPFEKEELILTLLNLQDNINKAIEIEQDRSDDIRVRKERISRALIYSRELSKETLEELGASDLRITDKESYYLLAVEVEAHQDKHLSSELAMNWKRLIAPLYFDFMENDQKRVYFSDYEGRIILIMAVEDPSVSVIDEDEIRYFIKFVQDKTAMGITVGVGRVHEGLGGIRKSYLEAINALGHRYQNGTNTIFYYDKITTEEKHFGFYSAEINEIILNHLHQRNYDLTLEVLESVFNEADIKHFSDSYKKMINMSLISLLLSYIVKSGRDIADVYEADFNPYQFLNTHPEIEQRRYIKIIYKTAFDYLNSHSISRTGQVARDAQQYILAHYANPELSIDELSKHLLVNQTYLRKMFKSEFGTTLSEFITSVRMDKSKQLIQEGRYKLASIAEMVGYNDPGYFSKCFKNHFGCSPKEFLS